MPEITIGSRIRKSPFYESTVAADVSSFTIYNKMYMPSGYGDPQAEYRRLTEGVAVWDVAAERQVEIAGPDAAAFAQYLSARDLTTLKINRARYAPLCDHQGRLINDPVILRVAEDRYWISIADSDVLLWARAIAGERNAQVQVFEPDVSPLAIQGPKSPHLARDLFGPIADELGFFHHAPVELDGIPIVLCRSGWSKQGGFELFLTDGSQGNRLWDLVTAAGDKYDIGPGSPNHQERLESGLLSFGSDHDWDADPFDCGLGEYVSLGVDHDFVGKQALLARNGAAVGRPIVNVRLAGEYVPCTSPWSAFVDGEPVGMLRNATWSPRLDAWIGLAQVQASHAAPGTTITVDADGAMVTATITAEPFGAIQATRALNAAPV